MPNHDEAFIETYDWGIIANTPWGPVIRTNEELRRLEEEVNNLPEMEWRKDEPTVSTLDLVDMCLNADGTEDKGMTNSLRQLRNAWRDDIKALRYKATEIEEGVRKRKGLTPQQRKNDIENLTMLYVDFPISQIEEKLARVERVLSLVGGKNTKENALNLERAKQFPIEDLLEFNRAGFAPCLWHNEKTPSMKLYRKQNKVHCFGCGKGGDAVDVYQIVRNCSFVDAVKELGK